MKVHYVVLSLFLLFAACGPSRQDIKQQQYQQEQARQYQETQERYRAEDRATMAACTTAYPSTERNATNAVPFAKCIIDAVPRLHNVPDDLAMAAAYKRLELAEKLANGQITLAEYQSQLSDYAAQVNTQRQLRRNQAQIAQAAQQQANAAQQQANAADCMAARQKSANDQAEANAQAAANQNNNSPAAGLAALASSALLITDGIAERRACNP